MGAMRTPFVRLPLAFSVRIPHSAQGEGCEPHPQKWGGVVQVQRGRLSPFPIMRTCEHPYQLKGDAFPEGDDRSCEVSLCAEAYVTPSVALVAYGYSTS